MKEYTYTVDGTTGDGRTFRKSGTLECELADLTDQILREAFADPSEGKAILDHPGVGSQGSYDIIKLSVWQRRDDSLPFVGSPSIVPK